MYLTLVSKLYYLKLFIFNLGLSPEEAWFPSMLLENYGRNNIEGHRDVSGQKIH